MKNQRFFYFSLVFITTLLVTPAIYAQNSGSSVLTGIVTDAAGGAPLPGVSVRATLVSDTTVTRYTYANSVGKYRFSKLFPGSYLVNFSLLGYLDKSFTVDVNDTKPDTLNAELSVQPLNSQDVIVTSSRHEEKELHSPASISVVTAQQISNQIDATPTDVLQTVPGVNVGHEGIAYSTYASREFHSVYGSDMLTMNDYHSLELPGLAIFYGILIPIDMDDIDHVEVIRGPGSALYGPEAATGVVNFISKSPFASQGTNLSFAGGERDYTNANFRNDESIGDKFAFSISGHYLAADDWHLADDPLEDKAKHTADSLLTSSAPLTTAQKDSLGRIGNRDYNLETYSFNARAEAILADDLTVNVNAGLADIVNGVAMTEDFGDAQIKDWTYDFLQARINYKDLFIQGAVNHDNTSSTDGSYFLPTGALIDDHSSTYVAQIQDHWDPFSAEKLSFGGDYKAIVPLSDNTIYGPDDGHTNTQIYGAYLQSQTSLLDDALEIVLAGRVDKDVSEGASLSPIFSPRAAVVYHFDDNNLVRAMYNSTYLLPTEVDLFSDLLYQNDPFGFGNYGLAGPNLRYVSPYVSGMNFQPVPGGFNMFTTLQPGGPVPSNNAVTTLWPTIQGLVVAGLNAKRQSIDSLAAQVFSTISAPTPQQALTYLAYLNLHPSASSPSPFLVIPAGQAPINISPIQPQHEQTLELDYQGEISKSFQFEIDAYQTHYDAIRASTVALTPNVFADPTSLTTYLIDSLTPKIGAAAATALADSVVKTVAALPLGVVQPTGSPANESYPDDVLIGTRNYIENTIQFYGVDFFGTYVANTDWSFDGSFSWMNKNYWYASELEPGADSTLQSPFALNMPKYRASAGIKYSGLTRGLSVELRDRWSDAFQMYDNYWVGNVTAAHTVDLTINYRIESLNNLQLTLSMTNVLNNLHQEFVGAPYIGRLTVLRAAYTLPPF